MWAAKKRVLVSYLRSADSYDELYREEQARKFRVVIELIEPTEEDLILDAGCGTALLAEFLQTVGCRLVGVDFARSMIKKAMSKTGSRNVDLVIADVDALPFAPGSFTKTLAITLAQNLLDPAATLRELDRVTREGGLVVISGLRVNWPEQLTRLVSDERRAKLVGTPDLNDVIASYQKTPRCGSKILKQQT
jgi:ubiquinone/menaquinone biosynthesis C-methylase UbiE